MIKLKTNKTFTEQQKTIRNKKKIKIKLKKIIIYH